MNKNNETHLKIAMIQIQNVKQNKTFRKKKVEYLARQSHAKVIMHRFLDVSRHKLILTTICTVHVIAASDLKKRDENRYETQKSKKVDKKAKGSKKIKGLYIVVATCEILPHGPPPKTSFAFAIQL